MRRALGVIGLIGVGVLVGFVVRLVWPHRRRRAATGYSAAQPPDAG